MSSLICPGKSNFFYICVTQNKYEKLNLSLMNNEQFCEIGNFEKYTPNGRCAYLFHEVMNAKALTSMTNNSPSTPY